MDETTSSIVLFLIAILVAVLNAIILVVFSRKLKKITDDLLTKHRHRPDEAG